MSERTPNVTKTVAWFMAQKGVIKFEEDEATYKLADAVIKASNFEKFPLRKGDSVEIGIKENVVTFLRKKKSETKSEPKGSEEAYEPTPEEEKGVVEPEKPKSVPQTESNTPIVDGSMRELTVFAVAQNKKVVKFTELKDAGWFQIDEAIQAMDYTTIGLVARNKVMVLFNDKTVVSLAKVFSEPAETAQDKPSEAKTHPATTSTPAPAQTAKKEWKPTSQYNDDRQTSIEAQAAVNAASNVASRVAASISPAPTANVINNMIRAIAESNFALIQELKKK